MTQFIVDRATHASNNKIEDYSNKNELELQVRCFACFIYDINS